jgi:hypothetical protein
MSRTSYAREYADLRLGGRLDETLAAMRADGLTIDQIVDALRARDIDVSRESVRRWLVKAS